MSLLSKLKDTLGESPMIGKIEKSIIQSYKALSGYKSGHGCNSDPDDNLDSRE